MGEYEQLTFEELLVKAIDSREDTAPLLAEAQRRDLSAIRELVAVTGVPLTQEWTAIGLVSWPDLPMDREIALCWRLTPAQPPAPASVRVTQSEKPMGFARERRAEG